MFAFTAVAVLLFLLALLFLAVVFGLTWKFKGIKTALILTGILFVFIVGVFLVVFLVTPILISA